MVIYKQPEYSVAQRVEDLLARMTLEEKIAQLGAQWLLLDENGDHKERGLEMVSGTDSRSLDDKIKHGLGQITRALGTHTVDAQAGVKALNKFQQYLVKRFS